MGLREMVFGPPYLASYDSSWVFSDRKILLSDVQDVWDVFGEVCDEVRLHHFDVESQDIGDELAPLDGQDESEYKSLVLVGYLTGGKWPALQFVFGSHTRSVLQVHLMRVDEAYCVVPSRDPSTGRLRPASDARKDEAERKKSELKSAAGKAAQKLAQRGSRRISLKRRTSLLGALGWLAVVTSFVWFGDAVRWNPPLLLVAGVALVLGRLRLGEWLRLRRQDELSQRQEGIVAIRPFMRDAWRERRWNTKRDVWIALAGAVGGAATALVGTYVAMNM